MFCVYDRREQLRLDLHDSRRNSNRWRCRIMRKLGLAIVFVALFAFDAFADQVTLNSPETLSVPTATKLDWKVTLVDATQKIMEVKYRWIDASLTPIQLAGTNSQWRIWTCRDIPVQNPADCIGMG